LCQTHDLLQCRCSNNDHAVSSSANSDDEAELLDPAEIARGAVARKAEKKIASDAGSDSESESDVEMGFVPASQVKPNKISKAVRPFILSSSVILKSPLYLICRLLVSLPEQEKKRKREALAALSEWRHINCFADNYAELIQDPVLLHLLQGVDEAMVSSFFESGRHTEPTHQSHGGKSKDWGGLISFAFEKRSGAQIS
jgi:hypothetical protein